MTLKKNKETWGGKKKKKAYTIAILVLDLCFFLVFNSFVLLLKTKSSDFLLKTKQITLNLTVHHFVEHGKNIGQTPDNYIDFNVFKISDERKHSHKYLE